MKQRLLDPLGTDVTPKLEMHRAYSDKLAESSRGLARGMVEGLFFDKKT
jgi:hypothetical protein